MVGAFGKGFKHLKTSLFHQLFQLAIGKQVVIAIQRLALLSPGYSYILWFKPELGLIAVPHGDEGFAPGL